MLDPRGRTYFSGCWVPEVFDTEKYENQRNDQHAEEQSTDLVPAAGLLSGLGCFCLINYKRAISRGLLPIHGGFEYTHTRHLSRWPTPGRELPRGEARRQLTSRKRHSSGPSRDVPPMISAAGCSLRARTSRLRGGVTEALGCTCRGKAGFLRLR